MSPEEVLPPHAPRYGVAALSDLVPSVLAGWGITDNDATLRLEPPPHVVVLLVDGMGADQLAASAEHAPFLAEAFQTLVIDAGFPATTPVSLTTLGTGRPPGEHGLLGFLMRDPDTGAVLNLIKLPDDIDPHRLQPGGTAFGAAVAAGVSVHNVGPRRFAGDALTVAGLRGAEAAGADSVGERVDRVSTAIGDARTEGVRSLSYVYFGDLDATGHQNGWRSVAWQQELRHVDRMVEQLAGQLTADTLLLVTADHGMVDVPFDARYDIAREPDLAAGVETVAGDPRAVYVHARPGAEDDVLAAWSERLGDQAWVCSRGEAIAAGWFGPVFHDRFRGRVGDVVAAMRDDIAVVDSRTLPPEALRLRGLHGSLTPAEQRVPLLALRR